MNLDIFLSIVFASGLFVILRSFSKFSIDNFQAIVINYFVAAICSLFHHFDKNSSHLNEMGAFIHVSFIIGMLFILVFTLTAKVTQISGVGIASVASKLSMVIPITTGIFLYNEDLSAKKIAGLLLALIAVFLVSQNNEKTKGSGILIYFLPLLLFIGCGLVDTSIKFVQHFYFSENNRQLFIMSLFGCAGVIGMFKLIYDFQVYKKYVSLKSIAGGVVLGICNYFSLLFLIRSFEHPGAESSKVFAMVNLGIVILSAFWGIVIFKEKLNRNKIYGISIAVLAILVLLFV